MSKYNKQYYDDVAQILRLRYAFYQSYEAQLALESTAQAFVSLFAADSQACVRCGVKDPRPEAVCSVLMYMTPIKQYHLFGSFNREKFLTACGLKVDGD